MSRATGRSALLRSPRILALGATLAYLAMLAGAAGQPPSSTALGLGQPATSQELSQFFAIPPDGAGLPDGKGSVADGQKIFAEKCAMCHGEKLQGIKETGGPALAGGRGSLQKIPPTKTVESYWPYATTLFDYIKRAMPINAPGSLKDDEVYALCAYILAQGHVVPNQTVLDKVSLPKVVMPNRAGFTPFHGPDPRLYH